MNSATEPRSNEMAATSTFSYAQAAKGHGAPSSIASPNSPSQPQGTTTSLAPEISAESADGSRVNDYRPHVAVEKQDVDSNIGSESDLHSETIHDRHSESRRDDDSGRLDRPWRRSDKDTRSSSTAGRSVEGQESRRSRKGKKSKGSDKHSNDQLSGPERPKEVAQEFPKVELSEAPIPLVNIWLQRKEQQAKATPNGATAHDGETKKPVKIIPTSTNAASKENAPMNGTKSNRRLGDSGRPDRSGSRGSRMAERDGKSELPPSVEDAASWPTPEIAIKEELKKPVTIKPITSHEKENQDESSQSKRQKEKWVTYDYVPTVSFETQLPQMRNSKARGGARGTNSGRTTASGNQTSDKTATANANVNSSKPSEPKERTKDSSVAASRTNPIPTNPKRSSIDVSNVVKESKKSAPTGGDKTKDTSSTQSSYQQQTTNSTRTEGRADRGRGNYRGRGAHHPVNSHTHHHNAGFNNNGSVPGRSQGPYSPPPRQGPHGQGFMPPPQRGGRGRNGTGNNFHRMSLPNGVTRLPPIQATFGGSYEYPMHPISAVPFQQPPQYWDNMVISLLKSQIEYYFSIENLCKDMYLRKRMDSQGFVNLHFVAAFKRIRELTQDMAMIRAVCETSTEIDFVVGEDDIERLRRRNGWQSFILPMEDRDDFARNGGPSQLTFKNRPFNCAPPFGGAVPMTFAMPQMGFSPPGDGQFHHFSEGTSPSSCQPMNGALNGHNTQLSADVPDFSPSGFAVSRVQGQDPSKSHAVESMDGVAMANGIHAE